MNVRSRISNKDLFIQISGKFDFSIHQDVRKAYINITPASIENIEVDMMAVEYLDSAALGMLLLLAEHFPDIKIRITHTGKAVRQVLDIANFSKKFDIR